MNFDNDTVLEYYEKEMRYDYVLALKSHPCVFLKKSRCRIHSHAPLMCGIYFNNSADNMKESNVSCLRRCSSI